MLLLDTLGELAQRLRARDASCSSAAAWCPSGGHNVLEPAVAGKAVIVGPHMENFQEIADEFRSEGAMVQVASADELGREVGALMLDEPRRRRARASARAASSTATAAR